MKLMPALGPHCRYCAYPLFDSSYLICGQCIKNPPSIDQALMAYQFEEPLRQLVHHFKYHQGLYLGSFLCQLMLHAWQHNPIPLHYLIPVPLHPKKLRARGFNQAAVLTKLLGQALNLPYDLISCEKTQNTAAQASLDSKQRQNNLRHAFSVSPIPSSHVTLVDDLFTTGSTANELARTLKKSGVQHVTIWCCARAVMHRDK